jgi:hypothetical protein
MHTQAQACGREAPEDGKCYGEVQEKVGGECGLAEKD